jgi:hypothetical protein
VKLPIQAAPIERIMNYIPVKADGIIGLMESGKKDKWVEGLAVCKKNGNVISTMSGRVEGGCSHDFCTAAKNAAADALRPTCSGTVSHSTARCTYGSGCK